MKLFKKKTIKDLLPPPIETKEGGYSMILSSQDDHSQPTDEMIKIALKACTKAQDLDLEALKERIQDSNIGILYFSEYAPWPVCPFCGSSRQTDIQDTHRIL